MAEAFRLKADRVINGATYARAGDNVYRLAGTDYGCASDDTAILGVHHISVTNDPGGGYPFFTVPSADLAALPTKEGEA